ncbi:MAG: YkgJ family cysteine cluster protein [Myxococcota bacterium]|nr:YkgJ family cysteine cluster protein [Myxococcota bacterium]
MIKRVGSRGFSSAGIIDFNECSQAATEHPYIENHTTDEPISLDFEEQPDCANCKDSCCVAPHVTELCNEDISRLEAAGLDWAIAPGTPKEDLSPSLKQNEGRCVFLTPANRCSIYSARPMVCRAFPIQLIRANNSKLRFSSSCRSRTAITHEDEVRRMAKNARLSFERKQNDLDKAKKHPEQVVDEGLGRYYGLTKPSTPDFSQCFNDVLVSKTEKVE